MGKALRWMRETRLGVRLLAMLCCALVALSLVPVLSISFYNHSYYDDFATGGQAARAVWEDTHSVWALLTEAFSTAASSYENWEGNFVPNYLNSIQLGAISQDLCFAVTFVLVFALVMSWVYLCGALCEAMRATPALRWLMAGLFVFLSVHFVPHPNEAFFWQSGGTKYTLGHVFLALLLGVTVKKAACASVSKTREGLRTAGMCFCAVLCAGSNLMTGLGAAVGLCLYTVYVWWADRHVKLSMTLGTVSVLLGFAANVLAPGNITRQGVAQMGSPVVAVMESITATVEYIGRWVTLPWVAVLLLLLPFLYASAKGSGWAFRHPILMMLGSFAALAAQLAPIIYSGVYYDTGRIVNTMYLSFCLFMLVNAWYLAGYAARRGEEKRDEAEAKEQTLSPAAALALALVLAVGCAGYGLTKMTGGAAARALLTGQAVRYDAAYRERMARLEDPAENPVIIQPLEDVPLVFMQENTTSWRAMMLAMGGFYGKEIVDGR